MKKFLVRFGVFLLMTGGAGIIHHYSLVFKSIKDEQEMYSGQSIHMVLMQSTYGMDPYLTCLISGGAFIGLSLFLSEYSKRNQLTLELIQSIKKDINSNYEVQDDREVNQEQFKGPQASVEDDHTNSTSDDEKDGRFYWKG